MADERVRISRERREEHNDAAVAGLTAMYTPVFEKNGKLKELIPKGQSKPKKPAKKK